MRALFIILSIFFTNVSFADRTEMRHSVRAMVQTRLPIPNWSDLVAQALNATEDEMIDGCRSRHHGRIEPTSPNRRGILRTALSMIDLNSETGYDFFVNHSNGRTEIACRRTASRGGRRYFECEAIIHRFCSYHNNRDSSPPVYNDHREIPVKPSGSIETDKSSAQD